MKNLQHAGRLKYLLLAIVALAGFNLPMAQGQTIQASINAPAVICPGYQYRITSKVQQSRGTPLYHWEVNGLTSSRNFFDFQSSIPGTYQIRLRLVDFPSHDTLFLTRSIRVLTQGECDSLLEVNLSPLPDTICITPYPWDHTSVSIQGGSGSYQIRWKGIECRLGDGRVRLRGRNSTGNAEVVVNVYDQKTGAYGTDTLRIYYKYDTTCPPPPVVFESEPKRLAAFGCVGTPITLSGIHSFQLPFKFSWDMGDGTRYKGQHIRHTYLQRGVYSVTQCMIDTVHSDTICKSLNFRVYERCWTGPRIKESKTDKDSLCVLEMTTLELTPGTQRPNALNVYPPPLDILWDLGDGTLIPGQRRINHIYQAPGTYQALAMVIDTVYNDTTADTLTIHVRECRPLSTDADLAKLIEIYPNPTLGHFQIDFSGNAISGSNRLHVHDVYGRRLFTAKAVSRKTSLDVSHLAPGAYYLVVEREGHNLIRKKIIKH